MMNYWKRIISFVCFILMCFFSAEGFGQETKGLVLSQKTLQRWPDPIIVQGKIVQDIVGSPLSNIRLYALREGAFQPIRYQIDEMTDDGDLILPDGPFPNAFLGNGKFDARDMLIFMAKDVGDRVSKEAWTSGYTKGSEIEVIDPITREKGWIYLLYFASNPPPKSPLPDYLHYDYDTENFTSDFWGINYLISEDGRHTNYYRDMWTPKQAGGSGENYVDRLKTRITAKMLFGAVTLHFNEDIIKCNAVAYKIGPVRLTRRLENYVQAPGGVKFLRVLIDLTYYNNIAICPLQFNPPIKLDTLLSSAIIRIGTDYTSTVIGARTYNSFNTQGFDVDGKMDDGEKNFNTGRDNWRLITGPFGTLMSRNMISDETLQHIKITQGLLDDASYDDSPERERGVYGYTYQNWDITKLPKGTYTLFLNFYWPVDYKPRDEQKYLNITDNLLVLCSGGKEMPNQILYMPQIGKVYTKYRSLGNTMEAVHKYNKNHEQTIDKEFRK